MKQPFLIRLTDSDGDIVIVNANSINSIYCNTDEVSHRKTNEDGSLRDDFTSIELVPRSYDILMSNGNTVTISSEEYDKKIKGFEV